MKYIFSNREKLLMAFLAVILVVAGYYICVQQPVQSAMDEINAQTESTALMTQSYQLHMMSMQGKAQELDELKENKLDASILPTYDNREAVLKALSAALADSVSYSVQFDDAVTLESGLICRTVEISCQCTNYQTARTILERISSTGFRSSIGNVSMSAQTARSDAAPGAETVQETAAELEKDQVVMTFTVSFFERKA